MEFNVVLLNLHVLVPYAYHCYATIHARNGQSVVCGLRLLVRNLPDNREGGIIETCINSTSQQCKRTGISNERQM